MSGGREVRNEKSRLSSWSIWEPSRVVNRNGDMKTTVGYDAVHGDIFLLFLQNI